jgi:pilus assembly protein Flp/PilA
MNNLILRIIARLQDEQGQALAEYGLVIALIAVACILAIGFLADGLIATFNEFTAELT